MRPGSKKSMVWQFFKKSSDGKFATCTICRQQLKYFISTTNLRQHLKRKHYEVYPQATETPFQEDNATDSKRQIEPVASTSTNLPSSTNWCANWCTTSITPADTDSDTPAGTSSEPEDPASSIGVVPKGRRTRQLRLSGSRIGGISGREKNDINCSLLRMIVCDYQPLSIVENPGFLELTKKLNPWYKLPDRKILTTHMLPELYNECANKVKLMLNAVENVSITTDIWTSDSNKSYITVTSHFIYENKINSYVLATREMIDGHQTADNIAGILLKILKEWKIENKIVMVVSDNGDNIKCAIKERLHMYHHACVAHTLNLCVNDSLHSPKNKVISGLVKKCRTLVGHFKHSTLANEKLRSSQEQMGLPILKLKQDVITIWNSCLLMMERLLKVKDPLCVTVANLPRAPEFLVADEWAVLEDCVLILKPLEVMTIELSGEKYTTLALVIPLIRGLQYTLRNTVLQTEPGALLQNNLIDCISRRLGLFETNKIAAMATFLDPRLKKTAFGLEENASNAEKFISQELSLIITKERINSLKSEPGDDPKSDTPESEKNSLSLWSQFDSKVAQVKSNLTSITPTVLIRQYLEIPHLKRRENPLDFWEKHKYAFPELYKLHMKYLSIPATSVPSERVFTKAGQLKNVRRNQLLPKCLDEIIFLNSYY